jgi:hypothetical protein
MTLTNLDRETIIKSMDDKATGNELLALLDFVTEQMNQESEGVPVSEVAS